MSDHLLTLNAGSSSIKYALFAAGGDLTAPARVGQVEGLGARGLSHAQAMARVLADVRGARIVAVGHRVVHGGTRFAEPELIDDAALGAMAELEPLAPLHQPHNLAGVRAARAAFPGVPQVGCFDTAFHRTQPHLNQRFALPQALHDAGVRRYGFHGLSYESIRDQLLALDAAANSNEARQRIVIAHLGNGASMCALRDAKSVATTMSFSPLDGLPMGTRCGRIDAAVVLHLLQQRSADDVVRLLYRESGLLGLSGESSDVRELLASNRAEARLAIDYFVEHAAHELAGMVAALRGIDELVFTGGIGENAASVRAGIADAAGWMGLALDPAANDATSGARPGLISARHSRVRVRVLHTQEEAVIARHTSRMAGATNGETMSETSPC